MNPIAVSLDDVQASSSSILLVTSFRISVIDLQCFVSIIWIDVKISLPIDRCDFIRHIEFQAVVGPGRIF